jgi:molybdate transport system substrate-binding protein
VRRISRPWLLAGLVVGLVAAGCGSDDSGSGSSTTTTTAASMLSGGITVSDAASLTDAFERIGQDFTTANPKTTVTFNPGSSSTLATQIQQTNGVGIDTFASADEANMGKLVTANLIDGSPVVFARNRLVIVTKPGNPENVKSLADLPNLNVVSLCGETVPCGKYAAQILQQANVTIPETKVTRGVDVKATLDAVTHGDADAAIVYVTDAKTAGKDVTAVAIPDDENAIAVYPIATLTSSANQEVSQAFVDYVTGSKGQAVLQSYGFLAPQ